MRRALTLLAATAVLAQDAKFSSDVRVVTLLATVRDRDGAIVKDLGKENFLLEEEGQQQEIRYFAQESDLPLKLVLLVDTSRSMQTVFQPERTASNRFLEQMLREDRDLAAVVHFDVKVGILQGFTSSRDRLARAMTKLKIPKRPATLLYDAIVQASEDLMRKQTGRKAFILLSDGMDVRSQNTITNAIEYAQRSDSMIYSILFPHRVRGPVVGRGRSVMKRLAAETGGGFFEVSASQPIDKIYAQIEDELRHQYSIGYTPNPKSSGTAYRKIRLTTDRKDLVVRTREGYYPE
jgi:VWFA-related protein